MQIDVFVFQGSTEPFDKAVVEEPALAVHRDADAGSAQLVGLGMSIFRVFRNAEVFS